MSLDLRLEGNVLENLISFEVECRLSITTHRIVVQFGQAVLNEQELSSFLRCKIYNSIRFLLVGHQGVVIDTEETSIFTDTIHRFFLILQIEELHRGWAINYQLGCNIMIFVALNPLDHTFSWHRFAACHRFFDIDGVLLAHLCGFARHALREHFHLGDHLRGLLLAFSLATAHYLTAVLPAGD